MVSQEVSRSESKRRAMLSQASAEENRFAMLIVKNFQRPV
jgi:hypothetical protein